MNVDLTPIYLGTELPMHTATGTDTQRHTHTYTHMSTELDSTEWSMAT